MTTGLNFDNRGDFMEDINLSNREYERFLSEPLSKPDYMALANGITQDNRPRNTERKHNYVMYHCHTEYSLLDSATQYPDYIELAVKNGMKAISFSEHGNLYNWTEKWGACKEVGLKYIHSVEVYLTETHEEKIRDNYHTVLMAKNYEGMLELTNLVSASFEDDHKYYKNRISFEEFLNTSDNIISTSACLASPLCKLPEDHPMFEALVKKYTFLEIQPHNLEEQKVFNQKLLWLAKKYDKPLIVGTDTHSSSPYKAECRTVFMAMKDIEFTNEDKCDLSFKTYDELCEMFRKQNAIPEEEWLEALENTNLLYDMVEDIELDTSIKYPILYGSPENDAKKFTELTYHNFEEKVRNGIISSEQVENFETAIKEELRVFEKVGMCGFMLCQSETVTWCKEQGFTIGTARGSVGGSRVAYVTDIIDLNPETWNTVFSRFCNEDRVEIGDQSLGLPVQRCA